MLVLALLPGIVLPKKMLLFLLMYLSVKQIFGLALFQMCVGKTVVDWASIFSIPILSRVNLVIHKGS